MGDLEYESKFSEMQKYIPFLDRVIEKLKNSDQDKPRKAQLEKMQTLHSLLHNKEKKLRIETLLKCETVLKKLHAKIDKSDDVVLSNQPSISTTTSISSNATTKLSSSPTAQRTTSTKNKFVPNRNLIEIYTCPASPTHLGEEDFRPPVEIPTERRSSPVKLVSSSRWDQIKNSKETIDETTRMPKTSSAVGFPKRSTDIYHSDNTNNHHKFTDAPKNIRWSDPRDISPSSPTFSSHRSSWSATSASKSSNNHRSHVQIRNESNFSSEEENWDEPEEEPLPKSKPDPKPTPHTLTSSSYSTHKDSKSTHHHRQYDNRYKSQIDHALPHQNPPPPTYASMPETNNGKDAFQNKIYHDTIYKYKKSDAFSSFMNPSPPEPRTQKHSAGNIFHRLGEKVDNGFENFRIQVKNDQIKGKATHKAITQTQTPPPPPPLLISTKPIGDVLKSPPLSADDIDDLLNESLEAAMEKHHIAKSNDSSQEHKIHSLDAVRKKLALISRPPAPSRLESPTMAENKAEEPFYRRGQTPIKKSVEVAHPNKSEIKTGLEESITSQTPTTKSHPLPSPKSPPNVMDTVVERLALKYNPHKRRESVSIERNHQLQNDKRNKPLLPMKDSVDSLGHRPKQSSHRESIVPPAHIVDPRVPTKSMAHIPPLMSLPISPVPNVLPTINHFDPRLRNTHPLNKDHIPFTVPKPYSPIPSLLDLHINIPLPKSVPKPPLPTYNVPNPNLNPTRIDPRSLQSSKAYADKFNPERNDKTERMKYLESKKNKPPEPKTYGEYRQSKCRQQLDEEGDGNSPQTTESPTTPAAPSMQSMVPSTLDKMYRSADYGKDISGSIQGFKIPKKAKPEISKINDLKIDNQETKSGEESKNESGSNVEQTVKNPQKPLENLTKKSDDDQLESANKLEELKNELNEIPREKEKSIEKLSKQNVKKALGVETKKQTIPETKKKKTKSHVSKNATPALEIETPAVEETKKQAKEIYSPNPKNETKTSESESNALECKTQISDADTLDDSITESKLVIDEGESPNKSKDETIVVSDESESSPEPRIMRSRRLQKKKNVIFDDTPPSELEIKKHLMDDVEKELSDSEKQESEVKPNRITTRRSTIIMKESSEEIDNRKSESPSQIRTRRRSASDIFSPTTDNSVVSTQNIISGKRKTRASINFNEKNTKKTPTPKTITSTVSSSPTTQTPKTRAAKAAESKLQSKKKNVVTPEQRKNAIEKKSSEDGQICAVSSTTEGPHNEPEIITDALVSPEEPSSSNAADQTKTPDKIVDADNQKKQEFIEGFLMSIVDPTANKDRIIDMLKSVLDDKKLQQVKEILYSPKKNENKNDKKEEEEHQEQSKPRVTRTKKNELDRLNEDIRDMFICQGVVTATGRRMCTLAKETSKKNSVQPKKKKIIQPKSDKSPVTTQPASALNKRRMRKAKVLISPLNIRALRSRNQKASRSPKMPVLEPNTPIKLSSCQSENKKSAEETPEMKRSKNKPEVKELNTNLKTRPGPKSKRQISISSDSSDDDIELVFLKNKIKRIDEMKNKTEKSKELVEQNDKVTTEEGKKVNLTKEETKKEECKEKDIKMLATKKDVDEKEIEIINKESKTTEDVSDQKPKDKLETLPKNNNPEFHSKSAYSNCCVICKERARFIAPHYLTAHNDSEVYTSRLPATVLENMKLNIGNRAHYAIPKKPQTLFNYSCPFCDFQTTHSLRGWMEHFTIHTGEYGHKCSNCFKAMNGCTHMMDHIKKFCPEARKIIRDPINLRGAIMGYVCQFCNFIQMLRGGVIRHLKVQHDLEDAESIAGIIEVKLIDSAGVPKKEENKTNISVTELPTSSSTIASVSTVPDVTGSKPDESCIEMIGSNKDERLKTIENDDDIIVTGLSANTITPSEDKPVDNKITEDDNEKPGKKSSMSTDSNVEEFLTRDVASPTVESLTEHSKSITTGEIIDLDSSVNEVSTVTDNLAANTSEMNVDEKSRKQSNNMVINVNMQVFLPRDLASPTSMNLTERLKSIEKDDAIASDSGVDKSKPGERKITIAEKLSQRFKNIEKQNITEEDAITDQSNLQTEKNNQEVSLSVPSDVEMEIPETPSTSGKLLPLPVNSPVSTEFLNESDKLVIDEQIQNESSTRSVGYCSESDEGNQNEEDDNDNWEDIEITETTKGGPQKDKNKNKSIFQTLSRLYASIAPKKSLKKNKDKEKKKVGETLERSEKNIEKSATEKSNSVKPVVDKILDPLLTASAKPTQQQQRMSNLSEFLPDSPGDSLDMLLTANFNCLDGDGNSFPHLDLNDLESSIFPLPEEQENIQDAIAMATDMDHIKYDVLGNPISSGQKPQPLQLSTSSIKPSSIQKIGNFGFSLYGNSFKYYCMVKSCAFLFSDHPDGLQNHFLLEHSTLKWDGYCDTCKMQVGYGNCREIKHMLDVHSRIETEDSSDKPRIKFRRLTGDILSTDKQQIVSLSSEDRFSPFDNSQTHTSPSHKTPSPIASPHYPSSSHTPELSLSSMLQSEPKAMIPPKASFHNPPPSYTPELSLSTMLQSEPKAMIPPKAPPKFDMDIPLFKNVSKEFTITNVAEGVTDNDLLNLVFKQADSAPGGIQISQVISLNAGGKSVSPVPLMQIPNRTTSNERRNSISLKEISSSIRDTEKQSPRASPKPNPISSSITQRNSILPKNPIPKQSTFICCVNTCSFFTNTRSAMNEHILSHIRCDNNRDSLKCHVCSFIGQDTNHYFNHMAQTHSKYDAVATSCASTVELTQKIQDILRTTSKQNQPSAKEQRSQVQQTTADEQKSSERDISFSKRLRKIAEEIVAPTGLPEEHVWRCIFYPECKFAVTEKDFQTHLATHTNIVPTSFPSIPPGSSLHCPHCTVNYYRPAVLKAHMKIHARHQFFCHACSCTTFGNFPQVQKHFTDIHSFSGVPRVRNLVPEEKSNNPVLLIASEAELSSSDLIQFGEKLIVDWERKKASNKTHFKPNEQNLLPIQPIFNNQVYCSVCNYKTKVRTNMFRHLQLHNQDVDVGSVDPVNPVPCLEKNEKHFDKMLNLACSSNTGSSMKPKENVKIPAFVPDMRRYVCGHPGCKYLTITDQMLRSHLNALHGHEKGYLCPHCQEEVCKKNMCAERVVQHLKFHGSKIYQCSECEYFHYTRHVVERHVNEKHASVPFVNLITYDRNENETKKSTQIVPGRNVSLSHSASSECDSTAECPTTSSTPPNNKMKWECALCKHQTATWNQMISHANSMHNAKHQYHCVHCTFGSAHLAHIMDHIDNKHPTKIREAKYVFYKINETLQDKAADTRPLWSRNDPKRVRSIRGILMENEEDAERTKKSLSRAGVDLDDEDEEIITPVSDSESSMIPDGLACFHCNFTSLEISTLSQHWKTKHWHEKNCEMVPKIPFFFRIHTVLKCPLCTHVGDQITLKIHLINVHSQRNFCAADPNLPNTCGHCPFVYPTKRLDVLTNHYLREHKPTDAKNLSSGLLKNLLALGECQVYMQCYFCAEICADKTAIIEHERERHKNSNFRYKQIKDEVIYRCGMCQYSSTNELATLRHMIDHFAGFNICHFCKNVQSSFNSYMQHCYTFHTKALTNFKEIYNFEKISSFLGQMLLIFPNGLIAAKTNLLDTQYGNTERIQAMYDEICKKALEPPIPPLCMGRLLAKKSVEASTLLPPPPTTVTAKRIAKRRSTVAMGGCERELINRFLAPSGPQKIKKRKSSICGDFLQPTAPLFSTITTNLNNMIDSSEALRDVDESKTSEAQGFSFYGKKPDPIDLSKIYTHIAIGDKYAPVSVKKFSLLFKINTKVVVDAIDLRNYQSKKRSATYSRPCPASKKKKIA